MFHPGREQTVQVQGGRAYHLGKLTLAILRQFEAYVAERVGDPFEHVERWLGRVSEAETMRQLKVAEDLRDQLRFFSLAVPIAQRAIGTEQGLSKLLHLLLLARDTKATEEDAFSLALHLSEKAQAAAVIASAQGSGGAVASEHAEGNAPVPPGQESAGVT